MHTSSGFFYEVKVISTQTSLFTCRCRTAVTVDVVNSVCVCCFLSSLLPDLLSGGWLWGSFRYSEILGVCSCLSLMMYVKASTGTYIVISLVHMSHKTITSTPGKLHAWSWLRQVKGDQFLCSGNLEQAVSYFNLLFVWLVVYYLWVYLLLVFIRNTCSMSCIYMIRLQVAGHSKH